MYTLQELMWPEPGVCTEADLYARIKGPTAFLPDRQGIHFMSGGAAKFSTWHNLFNLGRWTQDCAIGSLALRLEGEGTFSLRIVHARQDASAQSVVDQEITLSRHAPETFDLSALAAQAHPFEVLFFTLHALTEGTLTRASWQTEDAPRRTPKLAISVTTFRRETAVQNTVARFRAHLARSPIGDHVQVLVVDNGQTLAEGQGGGVTVLHNANLGGAGGFSRGLIEARRRGCSHCLFMDDDASTHMEAIDRTWTLLAYATDPRTAVSGAMISEDTRWAIWEYGALFFERCRPLFMGTDLRELDELLDMEFEAALPKPRTFYGGWWFFAFPLDAVRHLAFPFFVRGDDVSFSLKNDFHMVTLNGVASIQESFTEKESPLTWYLDLRSHLAHHLSIPDMDIGARGLCKIAWWFFLRNLPRMHYDTLTGINLAVEDVLKGPGFFAENADMSARRALFSKFQDMEKWVDIGERHHAIPAVRQDPPGWLYRLVFKLTLNGLLIPGFTRLGAKIALRSKTRGHVGYCWGASEITVLNASRDKVYTVRHSKRRAAKEFVRLLRNTVVLIRSYETLKAQYTDDYDRLTSEAFWTETLNLDAADGAHEAA
jgi:GT2 family glycosyltransferase